MTRLPRPSSYTSVARRSIYDTQLTYTISQIHQVSSLNYHENFWNINRIIFENSLVRYFSLFGFGENRYRRTRAFPAVTLFVIGSFHSGANRKLIVGVIKITTKNNGKSQPSPDARERVLCQDLFEVHVCYSEEL